MNPTPNNVPMSSRRCEDSVPLVCLGPQGLPQAERDTMSEPTPGAMRAAQRILFDLNPTQAADEANQTGLARFIDEETVLPELLEACEALSKAAIAAQPYVRHAHTECQFNEQNNDANNALLNATLQGRAALAKTQGE